MSSVCGRVCLETIPSFMSVRSAVRVVTDTWTHTQTMSKLLQWHPLEKMAITSPIPPSRTMVCSFACFYIGLQGIIVFWQPLQKESPKMLTSKVWWMVCPQRHACLTKCLLFMQKVDLSLSWFLKKVNYHWLHTTIVVAWNYATSSRMSLLEWTSHW